MCVDERGFISAKLIAFPGFDERFSVLDVGDDAILDSELLSSPREDIEEFLGGYIVGCKHLFKTDNIAVENVFHHASVHLWNRNANRVDLRIASSSELSGLSPQNALFDRLDYHRDNIP